MRTVSCGEIGGVVSSAKGEGFPARLCPGVTGGAVRLGPRVLPVTLTARCLPRQTRVCAPHARVGAGSPPSFHPPHRDPHLPRGPGFSASRNPMPLQLQYVRTSIQPYLVLISNPPAGPATALARGQLLPTQPSLLSSPPPPPISWVSASIFTTSGPASSLRPLITSLYAELFRQHPGT